MDAWTQAAKLMCIRLQQSGVNMKGSSNGGLVYSTDGGRMCPACGRPLSGCTCKTKAMPTGYGALRVSRQTKGRGGKSVTLVKKRAFDAAALASFADPVPVWENGIVRIKRAWRQRKSR
jgi:hypothetical protein